MKYASDFRTIARNALRGRWTIAVIAGLLAGLLGAISTNGPKVEFRLDGGNLNLAVNYANQQLFSTQQGVLPELKGILVGGAIYFIIAAAVMAVVLFVLGSIIIMGYSRFNLDLVDGRKEPELGTLFGYFGNWKNAALTKLLQTICIILWSLLLIIPGIIASYSYAMTSYILAEHPDMDPGEAITLSKQMMAGNRWRLFCLQFSFIGWSLLAALTLGIGNLWLTPYTQAATAAFYREVSGSGTAAGRIGDL